MAFDIVEALVAWLSGVAGVPTYARVPDPRPKTFLTVERTGGGFTRGADRPTIVVQAWAETEAKAGALAYVVRDAAIDLPAAVAQVCRCEVETYYTFPDPESRQPRWQLQLSCVCRP